MLRLAASLAAGKPISLSQAITSHGHADPQREPPCATILQPDRPLRTITSRYTTVPGPCLSSRREQMKKYSTASLAPTAGMFRLNLS